LDIPHLPFWVIQKWKIHSYYITIPSQKQALTLLDEQRRMVAYLDSFLLARDLRQARLASHKGMISLRELQSQTQEELDALLPSCWIGRLRESFSMETFVILTSILLAVGGLVWFWQTRSCSIYHRFHYHDNEYQRCEECGKRFCTDRVDRYEKIIETISGVLGTTT
jgi:hypothetical protein